GTDIYDQNKNILLKSLNNHDSSIIIAYGGNGGRGNGSLKNSVNQAPKYSFEGKNGEERNILLRLTLIADIGLIGFPNAGKTTLINSLTRSKYKTADYKFTTTGPQPAVIELDEITQPLTIMDIPGLIEGASTGKGRGIEFLSQIERTKFLAVVVDQSKKAEINPIDTLKILKNELNQYSNALIHKIRLVILNKIDINRTRMNSALIKSVFPLSQSIYTSAKTGENLDRLKRTLFKMYTSQSNTLQKQAST
ncbi:MAG: 50S ribosome-binding GTPase, partial [Planctomycetes bacterium]|nr:50S ribosome-binding GTPase [Planctomycetota bacterium]